MHILYEIEHLSTYGGIERILTDKANYIAEKWGWTVTIVVLLHEEHRTAYPLSPKVNLVYLDIKSKGYMMCLESLWTLNKTVRQINPDIYITFQTIGALSCLFNTHNIPTVYEAHGIRTSMQHPIAMSVAERFADAVVVLTDRNKERYSKAKRVVKIQNFTHLQSNQETDYSAKRCIALGRLDFEKNFGRLINLWHRIHKIHPDWVLDIYGEGPEYTLLQRQIETLKLDNCINLKGLSKQVSVALHNASICLMTSVFEGLPMTLIEAHTCGISCISFDCPDGPAEIIHNEETGYLIPYDNDDEFVERLSLLMDSEPMRREMGIKARLAVQKFRPEHIMKKWQELFLSLYKQ